MNFNRFTTAYYLYLLELRQLCFKLLVIKLMKTKKINIYRITMP